MYLKRVTSSDPDIAFLKKVNEEAFPPEEQLPMDMQLSLSDKGLLDVLSMYEGEDFVGFTTVLSREGRAYVFLLAIEESFRGKGYGSKALELISERYPFGQLVLDIEPTDPTAENYTQRVRRKKFYLSCGLKESGYVLKYCGMEFEVLYFDRGVGFSLDLYQKTISDIAEIVSLCGYVGKFYPTVTKKK